ncbi:hypothetical protein Psch_02449 [Pelotomaculum schinkii]|uniref:Uncharacterized protein n=1 Tax=Pelotomaculum schinkii TaxID=78350 RepID=A0A4Y7R8W5_9FIRM|nr:hypothetical protein [Pelotomaculum schinkii]TEB05408.1 hypothetical protein Psch_02449 [Pelotomaculum schinkii]
MGLNLFKLEDLIARSLHEDVSVGDLPTKVRNYLNGDGWAFLFLIFSVLLS